MPLPQRLGFGPELQQRDGGNVPGQRRNENRGVVVGELGDSIVGTLAHRRGKKRESLEEPLDVGVIALFGKQTCRLRIPLRELSSLLTQVSELSIEVAALHVWSRIRPEPTD